jgi:ABC-type protease/lipase transport system fused ATPase/permease subunit
VLDEPTSNLDQEGCAALLHVLSVLQRRETTVIMVAHQYHLFKSMNKIAAIKAGQLEMYGPRDDVLSELQPKIITQSLQADTL